MGVGAMVGAGTGVGDGGIVGVADGVSIAIMIVGVGVARFVSSTKTPASVTHKHNVSAINPITPTTGDAGRDGCGVYGVGGVGVTTGGVGCCIGGWTRGVGVMGGGGVGAGGTIGVAGCGVNGWRHLIQNFAFCRFGAPQLRHVIIVGSGGVGDGGFGAGGCAGGGSGCPGLSCSVGPEICVPHLKQNRAPGLLFIDPHLGQGGTMSPPLVHFEYLFTVFAIYHQDTKTPRSQNYALDAMLDQRHSEVDQKTKPLSS